MSVRGVLPPPTRMDESSDDAEYVQRQLQADAPELEYAWQQLVVLADVAELNPELIDTVRELRVSEINAHSLDAKACNACGNFGSRDAYSKKQWIARSVRRCLACVEAGAAADADKMTTIEFKNNGLAPFFLAAAVEDCGNGLMTPEQMNTWVQTALEEPDIFKNILRLHSAKRRLVDHVSAHDLPTPDNTDILTSPAAINAFWVKCIKYSIFYVADDDFLDIDTKLRKALAKDSKSLKVLKLLHHIYMIGKEGNRRQRALEEKAEAETPTPAQRSALLRLKAKLVQQRAERRRAEIQFVPELSRLVTEIIRKMSDQQRSIMDRIVTDLPVPDPEPDKTTARLTDQIIHVAGTALFNECIELQRSGADPPDSAVPGFYDRPFPLPHRRRCDNCGDVDTYAEWRRPYCTSCGVRWTSPSFRRMDPVEKVCPICLEPPTSGCPSYTLVCGHTLHVRCLRYGYSIRVGETETSPEILKTCPLCQYPTVDDLEKNFDYDDEGDMPECPETWPFGANRQERERIVTDAVCAAEGAYLTASAAVRDLASFATLTKIALDIAAAKEEENAAEARLAELSRRPPSIQAAPDVARLMDDLGLSRFLPLLLADEAADMDTLKCLEAMDLKDMLLPRGARTKLLHALRRDML